MSFYWYPRPATQMRGTRKKGAALTPQQLRELLIKMFVDGVTPNELVAKKESCGLSNTVVQGIRDGRYYMDERAQILKQLRAEGMAVNMDAPYKTGRRKVAL